MDLDDLDDLGNHAPVPTRATKFAPKSSKVSLKPKSEPPLKPKIEEPAPAPVLEPQRVGAPIPSEKDEAGEGDEEGKDSKPPVGVATAPEPSTSNGTTPMEVNRKPEAEAVPMDEDGVVDDEVVREIDVYFNPSVGASAQLYVMQYPLRPSWRPYEIDERCEEVRVKSGGSEIEVDLSINVDSKNYDRECNSRLMMTKQTLSSSWRPPLATGYAVGVLMDNKLYLNPVHAVVQLRPSMEHLTSGASKNYVKGENEVSVRAEESSEVKSAGSSKKQAKKTASSAEQVTDNDEHWIQLEYHSSKSDLSTHYLQGMMAEENSPILFTMNPCDYVDLLCPGVPKQNLKTNGALRRILLSTPPDERIRMMLCKEPEVHRYSALRYNVPDVSDDVFLSELQRNALLVQGCWVPKTALTLQKPSNESLVKGYRLDVWARDYTLLMFSKRPVVHITELPVKKILADAIKKFLIVFATERSSLGDWKFKQGTDVSFMKQYPDIVSKQKQIWEGIETEMMKSLMKLQQGDRIGRGQDDSKNAQIKVAMASRLEKPPSSDKTSMKATSRVAPGRRTMSNETLEALPKALLKIFQSHKLSVYLSTFAEFGTFSGHSSQSGS
ncbi:DNA-directed RNA polymerase III subunit RPC5 isoform X2 [Rhodamnia argentea]|uniref:DNA-directed RNA polymerase III subunit RPC5 isoform X2 n=1 Tax=Rhodamnia argentea TaxID=178133 RepID=A0A8B8P3V3_9MYRT|nr:DNA-directed RNA polymerase III subunit RPC5 isoform X2 [Rhodamnia argentea]